ncbi:hypothetical protein ZHAS_00006782 [Anopheles sinensis]|uniref:Uncharacterized protein n=1 Tax=Anopheles sinensis TaxID=74873 RepID=A0A084VN15_ANOSI|nr:hypothetical protein ZHAS_00006782 [Anopheles sinensis]
MRPLTLINPIHLISRPAEPGQHVVRARFTTIVYLSCNFPTPNTASAAATTVWSKQRHIGLTETSDEETPESPRHRNMAPLEQAGRSVLPGAAP